MKSDILWLITARSGSKSIKNKNIKLLNDIPLIVYRIKSALSISEKKNVWVSTDSEEYASIARKAGANVPFIRPKELANDTATSNNVVLHAMDFAEKSGFKFAFIGLLEPTSPFVYYNDLLNAINLLRNNNKATSIVAVKETRPNTFFIQDDSEYLDILSSRFEKKKLMGRQEFITQITPSGGFYISKWDDFKAKKTFYTKKTLPYILPEECSLEIDEPIDWSLAEFFVNQKVVDFKNVIKNENNT
jgi:CMP-N-acetylneuraminic acid synthetase